MTKVLGVAIIGCGWVSDWHVEDGFAKLPELFEVRACCDLDAKKAQAFASRHGIDEHKLSYAELLARPEIDVVVICTPPGTHYEMVRQALAADCHVICEKPFTSSLALTDKLAEFEAASEGRVMPIFQYRYGDGLARVKHIIASGLAGRHFVTSVETAKRRDADYYAVPWRGKFATELGGVLLTQAIHLHDVASYLLGDAAEVCCFKTTRVNPIEVEDCAVASLRMQDGSLASFTATLGSARQVTRIRMCFERVTFEMQCFDLASMRPAEAEWQVIPMSEEIGAEITAEMESVAPAKPWFARQFELFHEAVTKGGPLPVTVADARRSLELVTAFFASNATGQAVRLPIDNSNALYYGWIPSPATQEG
ncbi:MAG: hypothetical protein ABS76_07595 [Pelagibacterium sp. SCN 64-44]|nr:MAG: hypothetical protein ABS76_07595 [Pelagibacterium sp. SCN 64-44]